MASCYKRGKYWYIDYLLNGKKYYINTKLPSSAAFKTKAEEKKKEIELYLIKVKNKNVVKVEGLSLKEASLKYMIEHLANKSVSHRESFLRAYKHLIKLISEEQNVKSVNKEIFNKYLEQLIPGRSIETIRTYIRYMRIFFNYLVEENVLIKSPVSKKLMPKAQKKPIKTFEPVLLENTLNIAKERDYQYYLVLQMLLLTGQRPCDVLRIKWKDIDLLNKKLIVRISKTNKIINFPIYDKLEEFIVNEIYKHFKCKSDEDFIFDKFTVETVGRRFRRIKAYLNNKERGIDLKTFRKTFASNLASNGMERSRIAELLGHDSVNTTFKYYASIKNDSLRKELNEII
ncbi:MAG TPA: site-specific integrase [Ignavibacteria bacterium]|nr:site-specific integrase [Ignavibacteria bacterium]